jgi:beta-N-acetylhexosaminidase
VVLVVAARTSRSGRYGHHCGTFVGGAPGCEPPASTTIASRPVRPLERPRLLAALLAVVALAAGVAGAIVGAAGSDGNRTARDGARGGSFLARIVPPAAGPKRPAPGPAAPRSVARLERRLTLERKVAQLFLFGFAGRDLTAEIFGRLRRLDIGGIVLAGPNYVDSTQLSQMAGEAGVIARDERHVPPWVLAIQDGGDLNSFPDLPPPVAPADLASVSEARAQAAETARSLHGLGLNGILGPTVDVGLQTGSALGARVYSDDPEQVARFAGATVRALHRGRMFSAAGHFPGLGGADQSTEEGPASVGLGPDELRERDFLPFEAAIEAGVPAVVLSHALYPINDFTAPASLSREVVTELLRGQLRFKGTAITDDLADAAITTSYPVPDAAVEALRAGADMLFISGPAGDQQAAYAAVLRALRGGDIPRARVDEAVRRILIAKERYGLIR